MKNRIWMVCIGALIHWMSVSKTAAPEHCHEYLANAVEAETQLDEAVVERLRRGNAQAWFMIESVSDWFMDVYGALVWFIG